MNRYKIPKRKSEDYRILLQKAHYTYSGKDKTFSKQMDDINNLYADLQKLVNSGVSIPLLETDPYKMSDSEFEDFYSALIIEHKILTRQESPQSIENRVIEEERKKQEELKEKHKEIISVTPPNARSTNSELKSVNFKTIPKRCIILSPVAAAFEENTLQSIDDIDKLIQEIS